MCGYFVLKFKLCYSVKLIVDRRLRLSMKRPLNKNRAGGGARLKLRHNSQPCYFEQNKDPTGPHTCVMFCT